MPSQTAIDDRGYFFSLPLLGTPDPSGELVPVKAAIAPLEMNGCMKLHLASPHTSVPLRPAPATNCTTRHVEFQGALWVLPKVLPQSGASSNSVETFTVRVRRVPIPAKPDPQSCKLDNNNNLVILAGPNWNLFGRGPGPRTPEELALHYKAMAVGCRNVDPPTSGPRQPTAAELDIEREFTDKELAGNLFTPEWCEEIDLFKGITGPERKETHVQMRVHPQEGGDFRGMDYVLRTEGDPSPPQEDEWKPLPARATLPEVQRCWVNMSRTLMGRGPLPPPPASSAAQRTLRKGI